MPHSSPLQLRVGPFTLGPELGRGGMGVVYGVRDADVAVKLLLPKESSESARASFGNEVRAIAQLQHPGIIWVHDHGVVSTQEAQASGGMLLAGSPWLAMERAERSLEDQPLPMSWPPLRALLRDLLDALAHAHAHGIVHRDIKVSNVLLCGNQQARPGLKLTDFGIAHAMGDDPSSAHVSGTLHYMPPEQIAGDPREHGPWTDLYALGCLAWKLASGRLPFAGLSRRGILHAHLFKEPPPLLLQGQQPSGFEAWLRLLLRKNRFQRFQRAADASAALLDLARGANLDHPQPAPLPDCWRRQLPPPPPSALLGVGLGLFGLRQPALAGRLSARDTLWSDLHDAARGQSVLRVLRGPSGIGKSRLARWLAVRADELGAASALWCHFDPSEAPVEAIRRMVASVFRSAGCSRTEVAERIRDWLDEAGGPLPGEVDALLELATPGGPVPLDDERARYEVLGRLIERLGAQRPVLLCLDDVHWGADGLGLAWTLLQRELPLLVLLLVDDARLSDRPLESHRLSALCELPRVRSLTLSPLDDSASRELVQDLLGFEPGLAAQITDFAAGNPGLASMVVAEQVAAGRVHSGVHGFRLPPGATLSLPADQRAGWASAIERVLATLPATARRFLWYAAILGMEVDFSEWTLLCDDPEGLLGGFQRQSAQLRVALQDTLLAAHLAVDTEAGWRFDQGMLREAVLADAAQHGALPGLHQRCAILLQRLGAPPERVGRQLRAAGQLEAALEPLFAGIAERRHTVGLSAALALLTTWTDTLTALRIPTHDPRWLRADLTRGEILHRQGHYKDALVCLIRAAELARTCGTVAQRASALFQICSVKQYLAQPDDPWRAEWYLLITQSKDPDATGKYWYSLGTAHQGHWAQRVEYLWRACACFEEAGDQRGVAAALRNMAMEYSIAGDDTQALKLHQRALDGFEALGLRAMVAECHNGFAESWRRMGRLDDAERGYTQALQTYRAIGSADQAYPLANLGILAVLRGRWITATQQLERARQRAEVQGRKVLLAIVSIGLLAPSAARGDWDSWDRHLPMLAALTRHGILDPDAALLAQIAGREALAAGQPERARPALSFAVTQWTALEQPQDAAEAQTLLDRCDSHTPR